MVPRLALALITAVGLASASRTSFAAPTTRPAAPAVSALSKDQITFFEAKVRPVLAANCYKCHSVAERKSKGGLVLDTREGWQKGGENGAVIVPRDPSKSKLLTAVRYTDPDLQMPPKGEKLTADEVSAIEQWIKMGAPDPRDAPPDHASKLTGLNDAAKAHWAFQPVKPQALPEPADKAWVQTPIDAFVRAKLEQNNLEPSPPAAKETLIRRATYDLIGLPPTPEEVAEFVKDKSPDAFERVVDRLLASPHYGERWGRYWLDTARYSDTTGNEDSKGEYRYPFAWTYRDYVIQSFNDDKPYDQFLKEQIAGDQLPETREDKVRLAALGFITVGKRFQNPNDTIDERIDAVTKGTMALTVSCARCHDHKFDPIPTADYYSLHGVFASTVEPADKPLIAPDPSGAEYEDFRKQLAEREAKSRELYFKLIETKSAEFRKKAAAYLLVATIGRRGADAEQMKLRYQVLSDEKLDRDIYQGGGLRRIRPNDPVFAPLFVFAQIPPEEFADRAPAALERIKDERGGRRQQPVNKLVLEAFSKVSADSLKSLRDVTEVYGRLFAGVDARADAYFQACRSATTTTVAGFDEDFVELISTPAPIEPLPALTADRLREIAPQLPVNNQGGYQRLQLASINELMLTHPGSPARAMVVEDSSRPRNSPIFIRGEQQNRGAVVPRRFLEILSGPKRPNFTEGSGRLELANAIATKENPLTARVMINRIWMHHFGQGIVRTPDDLGVQSEPPSHPELLDYLATRFADEGWSIKKMHRLIMLSSTYQQSSDTNAIAAASDRENRLLWRANLRRLDFEAVRDSMLVFTGTLDDTIGGKPVNLTDEPYSNRRSVYGYIDRGALPELMSQFDFADPDMANSQRTSTIVPQQALFFMNSPMSADAARKVTSRPEFTEAKDDAGRVLALYDVLFQRRPRAEEVWAARDFLKAVNSSVASAARANAAAPKADSREGANAQRTMAAKQQRQAEQAMKKKGGARSAIRNDGSLVERKPLTPWEQYAQALLFTNELAYVN